MRPGWCSYAEDIDGVTICQLEKMPCQQVRWCPVGSDWKENFQEFLKEKSK